MNCDMSIHICTDESLRAGIDEPPMECSFCGHQTLYIGWVDMTCTTCGAQSCDGDIRYTIQAVRHRMRFSRRELATEAGLSPKTLKNYEWCWPSKRYWEWLKGYTRRFYFVGPTPLIDQEAL